MYFPVGWPKQLKVNYNDNTDIHFLASSLDKSFVAVLSKKTIGIWFCKPNVELVSLKRSEDCLKQHGHNILLAWKPNSLLIAVVTSEQFMLFYRVDQNKQYPTCYEQLYSNNGIPEEGIPNLQSIPSLSLSLSHHIQIPGGVASMVSLKEDLVVGTGRGLIQRVGWVDGRIKTKFTVELASVPFPTDIHQTRATPLNDSSVHVTQLEYSFLIGGFAVVLSNGKAAFIVSPAPKFEPNLVVGVWAQEICDVTYVAINHKFSLIAFADNSGDGTVYQMDEATGSLVISHKLTISSKDLPDARQMCGGVSLMKWSVDGAVVVLAWKKGAFAVWSVFGSLLFHSTALHTGNPCSLQNTFKITSLEWGCEGYHLWMIQEETEKENKKDGDDVAWISCDGCDDNFNGVIDTDAENNQDSINNLTTVQTSLSKPNLLPFSSSSSHTIVASLADETASSSPSHIISSSSSSLSKLILFNFVKSSLYNNPFLGNQVHLLMQGEDKLYLNPEDGLSDSTHQSSPSVVSNRQWHVLTPPPSYLANNWPIRFAGMSVSGNWLAVAGRRGFTHYSLLSRRWKMFGNETQERDMLVTGGLGWWQEFICVPCYNFLDQNNEIRLYNRESKLDNSLMSHRRTHSATILTNVFLHLLITLSQDCNISIYALSRCQSPKSTQQAEITLLQEINIDNFIPHPSNVLAITLTSLRTDAGCEHTRGTEKQAESILINVAGRLLLFQRDRCLDNNQSPHNNWLAFTAPVVVASSVETLWLSWKCSQHKPHLTDALWLGCGASGLKVWLPLQLKEDMKSRRKGFLSKRIMLPFNADIYPLAMLFEAGIILGAMTESMPQQTSSSPSSSSSSSSSPSFSYLLLERTSQIYLHHILRQLLRRNLGIHALEIARSCTGLVYFSHVLELLVHEVLEEEATSKEPIPDALLPRVVAFVEEFPEYLQTIAHCARKSDAAVWECFFSVVGNPSDLFQNCLQSKELITASSYLIILQNLETPSQARQHAITLLDAALDDSMWDLARDLVRYLSAIVKDTVASPTSTTSGRKRQNSQSKYSNFYTPSPSSNVVDPFMHASVIRARSLSKDEIQAITKASEMPVTAVKRHDKQLSGSTSTTHPSTPLTTTLETHNELLDINMVLERHARKLMSSYSLCSLARFAANLDDYHLVAWLKKERLSSARVDDFVRALRTLHSDFQWPLPVIPTFQLPKLDSASLHFSSPDHSFNDVSSSRSSMQSAFKRSTSIDASEGGISLPDKNGSDSSSSHANTLDTLMRGEVDKLCLDILSISTGTPQANLQLRYLYQLLMEAECLEWALVVSVLLQDTSLFSRTVAAAYLPSTPHPTILRMLRGSQAFVRWSHDECPGYCSLVLSLKEDLLLLESVEKKVLATAAANKRTSLNSQQQQLLIEQQQLLIEQQHNITSHHQQHNTQHILTVSHQQSSESESHMTSNKFDEDLNDDDDDDTKHETANNGDVSRVDDDVEENNTNRMCSIS